MANRNSALKHSSGDLHSRLKTRKLLGVGETDDGDVHRSKLSQILGHSDQLYLRLPYGLRIWQFILASLFTALAAWTLLFPSSLIESHEDGAMPSTLYTRLYSSVLISMSIVLWGNIQCMDRNIIRVSLLASVVYFVLHTLFSAFSYSLSTSFSKQGLVAIVFRLSIIGVSVYFYGSMNREWRIKEHLNRN